MGMGIGTAPGVPQDPAERMREMTVGKYNTCRTFWLIDPKEGKEPRCPVCQRPLQPLVPEEDAPPPPREAITDQASCL
jgi:hypothetical protein